MPARSCPCAGKPRTRKSNFSNSWITQDEFSSTYENLTLGPTTQVASTRTKTSIPAPPSKVCVQFIGGTLNTEQKFYDLKDFPYEDKYRHAIPGEVSLKPDDVIEIGPGTTQVYKLVPIPTDETKWLPDHQVVIGVFIE